MTFGDLLDQIAENADDDTSTFRTSARRWLNLTRSYIADRSLWRTALARHVDDGGQLRHADAGPVLRWG